MMTWIWSESQSSINKLLGVQELCCHVPHSLWWFVGSQGLSACNTSWLLHSLILASANFYRNDH